MLRATGGWKVVMAFKFDCRTIKLIKLIHCANPFWLFIWKSRGNKTKIKYIYIVYVVMEISCAIG